MSDLLSAILIVLFPTSGKANKSTKKLRELEPNLTSLHKLITLCLFSPLEPVEGDLIALIIPDGLQII
jgi:hypothetical protein